MKRLLIIFFFTLITTASQATSILIPMDLEQKNHLKAYGIAYFDFMRRYAIAYPVPINLVVRFGRWIWHELIRHRPTKLDKMLQDAYIAGRLKGMLEEINGKRTNR